MSVKEDVFSSINNILQIKIQMSRKKKYTTFTIFDLRHIKELRHLCQVCWQFLSMTADGATKLRKGHHVKNVSFPHMSEHYGALNTLPGQTLFGELRRGHIISNLQRVGSLKLMRYADLHTWGMRHISLPLCISTVYFSTVEPGLLNGDLTFTP